MQEIGFQTPQPKINSNAQAFIKKHATLHWRRHAFGFHKTKGTKCKCVLHIGRTGSKTCLQAPRPHQGLLGRQAEPGVLPALIDARELLLCPGNQACPGSKKKAVAPGTNFSCNLGKGKAALKAWDYLEDQNSGFLEKASVP